MPGQEHSKHDGIKNKACRVAGTLDEMIWFIEFLREKVLGVGQPMSMALLCLLHLQEVCQRCSCEMVTFAYSEKNLRSILRSFLPIPAANKSETCKLFEVFFHSRLGSDRVFVTCCGSTMAAHSLAQPRSINILPSWLMLQPIATKTITAGTAWNFLGCLELLALMVIASQRPDNFQH